MCPFTAEGSCRVGLLAFPTESLLIFGFLIISALRLGLRDSVFYFSSPYYLGKRVIIIITTIIVVVITKHLANEGICSGFQATMSLKYEIQKLCSFLNYRDFLYLEKK